MLAEQMRGGTTRSILLFVTTVSSRRQDDGFTGLAPGQRLLSSSFLHQPHGKLAKGRVERKKGDSQNFPKVWAFSHLGGATCRFSK
jgi:hypothetical protein